MRLTIDAFHGKPNKTSSIKEDGTREERSSVFSQGSIDIDGRLLEFDKYFITNRSQKKRQDFVIFRELPAPELAEQFARLNRAFFVGQRAVRLSRAEFGVETANQGDGPGSRDYMYTAEPPLELKDLFAELEFAVTDDGTGFHWMRLSNQAFDVWIENPDHADAMYGVTMGTKSPDVSDPDWLHHRSWIHADALLQASNAKLPGFLGDIALRQAIWQLRPGELGEIYAA